MTTRPRRRRGGTTPAAPATWKDRLDDPDEPLYTVGVVGDLLHLSSQALRRLEDAISHTSSRPSGNQRRFSRRDIEALAAAAQLASEGNAASAIPTILALQRRIDELTSNGAAPPVDQPASGVVEEE